MTKGCRIFNLETFISPVSLKGQAVFLTGRAPLDLAGVDLRRRSRQPQGVLGTYAGASN